MLKQIILTFLALLLVVFTGQLTTSSVAQPALAQLVLTPAKQIEQQELSWQQDFEQYFGRTFARSLIPPAVMRTELQRLSAETGHESAVIYLVPRPQQLQLLLVTPGAAPIQQVLPTVDRATLLATAKQFRNNVADVQKTRSSGYLKPAQQLYQWLIAPLEAELQAQNIDTLLLCVGSGLRSLPFAALHDGQQFLIEKYNFSLIPAFSLLDVRSSDLRQAPVLAMGASQFQNQAPLPAVPQELSAVVKSQGGAAFLNRQFTVPNLRYQRQQQSFEIVHLATHAEFLPGAAYQSFIQFWDRELSLPQLQSLRLEQPAVNLLVLSACRTALGDQEAELGFSGLAIQSGAASALGSLWTVNDQATMALMLHFYRQLKTSPSKATSLRQAQIAMLQGGAIADQLPTDSSHTGLRPATALSPGNSQTWRHPHYWSAFTLIGSPW